MMLFSKKSPGDGAWVVRAHLERATGWVFSGYNAAVSGAKRQSKKSPNGFSGGISSEPNIPGLGIVSSSG